MSKQQTILNLLKAGKIIRRMDGRVGNGFVDKLALEALIRYGAVRVYDNGGVEFVKASPVTKSTDSAS